MPVDPGLGLERGQWSKGYVVKSQVCQTTSVGLLSKALAVNINVKRVK